MIRIALVRASYTAYGGAEVFVQRAMQALAQRGDLVRVSILARQWHSDDGAPPPGVEFITLNPTSRGRSARERSFAQAVQAHVQQHSYDLVQSHERIVGMPIYRAGDGVHADWLQARIRAGGWRTRLATWLSGHHRMMCATEAAMFADPRLQVVICNSEMVRSDIQRRFALPDHKLVMIRNGVDLPRFGPRDPAQRQALRRALDWPLDRSIFIYVGSGFERKGVAPAIRALAAMRQGHVEPQAAAFAQRRDAQPILIVVGADKHLTRYQALAKQLGVAEQIRWLGTRKDVPELLAAADAFVLPTLYDPFPNAALEAMAAGLPVVVGQRCGVAELLTGDFENAGQAVDPLQTEALARAMSRYLIPAQAERAGRAARKLAEQFPIEETANQLLALYQRLLDKR